MTGHADVRRPPTRVAVRASSGAVLAAAGTALLIGGGLGVRGRAPSDVALAAAFGAVLAALAWIDLARGAIPNRLVYPALLLAVVLSGFWSDRGPVEALIGATGSFALFAAAWVLSRGGLGGGDVKMATLAGAIVGLPGIAHAAFIMAIAGGATAIVVVIAGRAVRRERVPYGVAIALGALSTLLA